MGAAVPMSCPCGETHATKTIAMLCRARVRRVLRGVWGLGKLPSVRDIPPAVWQAANVVAQWANAEEYRRISERE